MKNADMPAMPVELSGFGTYEPIAYTVLTKREMMAMHIFSGMMSNNSYVGDMKFAVELTDALLAELDLTSK